MVNKWRELLCKDSLPKRKQRTDRDDRVIYRWVHINEADVGDCRNTKCRPSTKEGRKREFICGYSKYVYVITRSYSDRCLKERPRIKQEKPQQGLFGIPQNR